MIYRLVISLLLSAALSAMSAPSPQRQPPAAYNVTWTSPSSDPLDSMPLSGERGAGANVWVQDGSIWFYLAHNGAYDERGRLLKLGCLRLTPSPAIGRGDFRQELDLQTGSIRIHFSDTSGTEVSLTAWFAGEDLIVTTDEPLAASWQVDFGTWRDIARQDIVLDMWSKQATTADRVIPFPSHVLWFHRNSDHPSLLPERASRQGLQTQDALDRTSARVFGGAIAAADALRLMGDAPANWLHWPGGHSWSYATATDKPLRLGVALRAGEHLDPDSWPADLSPTLAPDGLAVARERSASRWKAFWGRSWIEVNPGRGPADEAWQTGRNHALFRYMLACNQGGELPLLFNGGIFTTDNSPGKIRGNNNDELPVTSGTPSSPDYRRWMFCSFMSQNQRWLGWPTLASGDADLLEPTLAFYRERAGAARARARLSNADGVAYTEPLDIWGLCATGDRPDALCGHAHLTYHFSMMVEHAWMALQAASVLGTDLDRDLDWVVGTLRFYDSFYRARHLKDHGTEFDPNGKLVLYPGSSVEATIGSTNPVDAVAGLHALTEGLLSLPHPALTAARRKWLEQFRSTLPAVPVGTRDGRQSVLIADSYEKAYNAWEFPEMYAAWPYRRIGVPVPGTVGLARATMDTIQEPWASKVRNFDYSWMPAIVNAAAAGMTAQAGEALIAKLSDRKAQVRFTAFFGPGHDWLPDHNWGGSAAVGLQSMLLQHDAEGEKLHLLPAWPVNWDVSFRLHAPRRTVIEVHYRNGTLEKLSVEPAHRLNDLVLPPGIQKP